MPTPREIFDSYSGQPNQDENTKTELIGQGLCSADDDTADANGLLKPSASTVLEAIKSGSI